MDKQGANPLVNPMLTFSLSEEQCVAALNSMDPEVTVNIYYRRNAGFYNVAHWVPHANIPASEIATYKTQYPDYNNDDGVYHRDGLVMVCLEHKQGRVGALTNARPYPAQKEDVLRSFVPQPFVQEEIATDTTRVDITYDVADSYSLIFLTDGGYIPRQHVDAGDTVTFSATATAKMSITKADGTASTALDYRNPTRQGYEFAGWKYEVKAIPGDATERDGDGKLYRPGESGYYTRENGKLYKSVLVADADPGNAWTLSGEALANTVAVQDSNGDHSKIIYLSPIWTPNEANVRVVFWTEDLGGASRDTKVTLSDSSESFPYCQNLPDEYLNGTPETVGANFSNVGSFTFMAPTGAELDLSVANEALASTTGGTFRATGETGPNADPKDLTTLISAMFAARMPSETVSAAAPLEPFSRRACRLVRLHGAGIVGEVPDLIAVGLLGVGDPVGGEDQVPGDGPLEVEVDFRSRDGLAARRRALVPRPTGEVVTGLGGRGNGVAAARVAHVRGHLLDVKRARPVVGTAIEIELDLVLRRLPQREDAQVARDARVPDVVGGDVARAVKVPALELPRPAAALGAIGNEGRVPRAVQGRVVEAEATRRDGVVHGVPWVRGIVAVPSLVVRTQVDAVLRQRFAVDRPAGAVFVFARFGVLGGDHVMDVEAFAVIVVVQVVGVVRRAHLDEALLAGVVHGRHGPSPVVPDARAVVHVDLSRHRFADDAVRELQWQHVRFGTGCLRFDEVR